MPPTTEPLSRDFLDETFFWIPADEHERRAVRAHNSPGTRYRLSLNTQFRVRGFAERKRRPLIRIGLGLCTASAHRETAGVAMPFLSAEQDAYASQGVRL
jgi:hypothetical protein